MLPLRFAFPSLPFVLFACSGVGDDTGNKRPAKDSIPDDSASDADGDGFTADDCNDDDASIHPGADDPCDGVDNDCDAQTDEDARPVYEDADGDGFGAADRPLACDGDGATNARDCDDANPDIFPGADEVCNALDDDCDGAPDDALPAIASWLDADGDGSGDPGSPNTACNVPSGYVTNDYDCDDHASSAPTWVQTTGRSGARGTLSDPVSTIQEGIERGAACVRVGPGDYYESIKFGGRSTEVRSTEGASATWIYANGDSAVTFDASETSAAVLDGFTISGSNGKTSYSTYTSTSDPYTYYYYYYYYYGGGIYISGASPTLRNLTITQCYLPTVSYSNYWDGYDYYGYSWYGYGGGVYVSSGSPTMTDVTLAYNQSGYGGGIYLESGVAFTGTRLKFEANYAEYGAALASSYYNTVNLDNVIVNANRSEYGIGAIYVGYESDVTINHGTIVSNDSGVFGDYYVGITVTNSILAGNDYGVYNASSDGGSTYLLSYNDVYSNTGGNYYGLDDPTGTSGNITISPHFTNWVNDTDPANDDLTLRSSSDCIDAGDPSETDLDGSGNDMGAFGGPNGGW